MFIARMPSNAKPRRTSTAKDRSAAETGSAAVATTPSSGSAAPAGSATTAEAGWVSSTAGSSSGGRAGTSSDIARPQRQGERTVRSLVRPDRDDDRAGGECTSFSASDRDYLGVDPFVTESS